MISRPQPVNTALPLPPPPPPIKKNRRVIASKRAAQNRAAQKAFRQRRDQYIKELEEQAKEAKESKQELNELRQENTKLKERVTALEHHIVLLTVVTALGISEGTSEEEGKGIELSTEHDTTKKADPAGLVPATMAHFWQDQQVDFDFAFDPFMENEFGMINEFLPNANNEQVLDDLFAMLQTRQRPQIPSSLEEMEKCS
ncbi:hypothetical protein BCV72DRAFT_249308 [Rhizopus microsporus var. microsporus]|uniref:Putative transcription factor kapC n=1 Tax=Rhizopus microsporus var. microsporus TaxID=86635 RepID=A0A1X0R6Y9_RHIZD|nr:hypothetical protein BCV72DRAFT_249308 [Rhizopus microsporus var. microsporus]